MRFKELLRLRLDETGRIPVQILRQLRLPMPDDVLEQFLGDHGVNPDFQRQYGSLDLHALTWQCVPTVASEVIACSVYAEFQEYFDSIKERTLKVAWNGWKDVMLPPAGKKHWQTHRTWLRSPLFIHGDMVDSARPLHLIEGHTRIGALKGLVECGWLPETSLHNIWLASRAKTPDLDNIWQEVLRVERMPFARWLVYRIPDEGDLGRVSSCVLSAMCEQKLVGDDLVAVLAFIATQPQLAAHTDLVRQEYDRWERETMK